MKKTADLLRALAGGSDDALNGEGRPKTNGFVLLVFPFDGPEGQRTNYISNAQRADILVGLKEIVARFEGQPYQRRAGVMAITPELLTAAVKLSLSLGLIIWFFRWVRKDIDKHGGS